MTRHKLQVVHPTGNQNVREVLSALVESDSLASFWTTVARGRGQAQTRLPKSLSALLAKRDFPMVDSDDIRTWPAGEVFRQVLKKVPAARIRSLTDTGAPLGIGWVSDRLDRRAARSIDRDATAVYGYLDHSMHTFRAAKKAGLTTILEAQHAHWLYTKEVVEAERHRNPAWASTLPLSREFEVSGPRQNDEVDLADVVVAPSTQVADSILRFRPDANVVQIPYGGPEVVDAMPPHSWDGKRPLRLLYVSRLQGLKGVADVAALQRHLGNEIELTVVGHRPSVENSELQRFISTSNYLGTVPRAEVLSLMATHDLLVLPSLVEGRSLSVLEGLSVGLPAIVTPGSGTDDIVSEGGGIVVPNAAPDALISAVQSILEHPWMVQEMSVTALSSARSASWTRFRERITHELTLLNL